MHYMKKMLAFLLIVALMLSINTLTYAQSPAISLAGKADGDGVFLTVTSDKYIFSATGTSAELAYTISVYDRESLELLTTITHRSPSTVYLRVNTMHVKGDYLYVVYTQRASNGNPCICKYNIKEIYEGKTMTPELTVGARPNAFAYIDDDVICRTDSGYVNFAFMDTESISDIAAIGVSSDNTSLLKGFKGLFMENGLLYAYNSSSIYVYDASYALRGVSKQDVQVYKCVISVGKTINMLTGYENYIYVATKKGLYIYEITDSGPVSCGTLESGVSVSALTVNNGKIYLSSDNGFRIYDISTPSSPSQLLDISGDEYIFNCIHLRPGKMYAGTSSGVSVYEISGIEISETTTPGSVESIKSINYKQKLGDFTGITDICGGDNYLFALAEDTTVNVIDSQSLKKVTEIYREDNNKKLTVTDMLVKNGWLYVSYSGSLRRYKLSEIKEGAMPRQEAVVPMFSDMSKNTETHITYSDKYIFAAASELARESVSNSKIFVFDKSTGEYLTSIWVDSGNANYDLAVRNMWTWGDRLYVTWNNAKVIKTYTASLAAVVNNLYRYQSPLFSYDISSITEAQSLSPSLVTQSSDITKLSHPYNRGGNSYLDEENGILYQGIYTQNNGQCYEAYDISEGTPTLVATWQNGSYDCVDFIVRNGYLYEVLDNNAGLTVSGTVTQQYNKVIKYKLETTNGTKVYDLTQKLEGSYQTSVYGDGTIKALEVSGNNLYIATASGIEIIDSQTMKKTSAITEIGSTSELELVDGILFASGVNGLYLYDVSQNLTLTAQYPKAARDFAVDSSRIYLAASRSEGYAQTLDYDKSTGEVTYAGGFILEDAVYNGSSVSDEYILTSSDNSDGDMSLITAYNRETGLKVADITVDEKPLSKLFAYGNCFYNFEGRALSIYKIPSASSNLSSCLAASYETTGDISALCFKGDNLYLATSDGMVVLNVASAASGTVSRITAVESGKKLNALSQNGEYIYASDDDNRLFLCHSTNYNTVAETSAESDPVIKDIAVSLNNIFCLLEDGTVSCYVSGDGIIVEYEVDIKQPEQKVLSEIVNERGFPDVDFSEHKYSEHSYVSAEGDYVVTSGIGGIAVFDKNMTRISDISAVSAGKPYIFGNKMIALVKTNSVRAMSYDLSGDEFVGKEIAVLDGSGLLHSDSQRIAVYDDSSKELSVYTHDGILLGVVTECPEDVTRLYCADGYVYLVSTNMVRLCDVSNLSGGSKISEEAVELASFTVTMEISDIEFVGDYVYVATNKGSKTANKLYVYNLSSAKTGNDATPSPDCRYNTISANQGGKISTLARQGDFLVANAQDANEIQIINIKDRVNPYRESFVIKTAEAFASFSDIAVEKNKIYGISSVGGLNVYDYNAVDIASIELDNDGEGKYARVSICNESGNDVKGKLFIAAYSGTAAETLKDLQSVDVTVPNGGETFAKTSVLNMDSYENITIKAMLFENTDSLKPLCQAVTDMNLFPCGDVTIYVDSSSSGAGDGSREAPFATILEAKEAVRKINRQMSGNITVELAGGRYELSEPLIFDENDSGFNGFQVIYKAKDGETPVISGGRAVTDWTIHDEEKGIYKANANGINTRQLIVDGERAIRARSQGGLTDASCDDGELGIYCYDDFIAKYKNIKDLELVFYGKFFSRRVGVDSAYKLDSSGRMLLALNRPFWQTSPGFNEYILPAYYENAYELLDEENEFYLDTREDVIYYKPKADTNIKQSEVIAPVLEELVILEGSDYYNRVHDIEFSGITFGDTTWLRPSVEGGFYPKQAGYYGIPNNFSVGVISSIFEAVLSMNKAEDIKVLDCTVRNAGANGIRIIEAASNIEITDSKITDVAAGGIYIGEINHADANPWDARRRIKDIKVTGNCMDNIALEYYSSCALALGTGQNVEITNNEISDTPYTAVHIGWGWDSSLKRNITGLNLSKNYIHDVVKLLGDGGAIYTTGKTLADKDTNPNIISENYIERVDGSIIFAGAAIYLDTGSSGYLVSGNVLDLSDNNSAWIPKWSTGSGENRFENNYTSTSRGASTAVNTTVVTDGNWPEEALQIQSEAGTDKK